MFSREIGFFLIVGILFSACAITLYIPTQKDAEKHNTSLGELKSGRALYVNKCSSCHNLYLPQQFSNQEWRPLLDKMQKRAQIDSSQKQLIYNYIELNAKDSK